MQCVIVFYTADHRTPGYYTQIKHLVESFYCCLIPFVSNLMCMFCFMVYIVYRLHFLVYILVGKLEMLFYLLFFSAYQLFPPLCLHPPKAFWILDGVSWISDTIQNFLFVWVSGRRTKSQTSESLRSLSGCSEPFRKWQHCFHISVVMAQKINRVWWQDISRTSICINVLYADYPQKYL